MNPPRPPGSVLRAMVQGLADPLGAMAGWTHSATAPLVRAPFFIPGMRFFVVTHPDLIETLLVKRHREFRKDWYTAKLEEVLGQGLLTSHGEHWKRQRKLAQPAFHSTQVRRYAEVMGDLTVQSLQTWPDDGEIDVHDEMMRLTFQIVSETLFGASVKAGAEAIGTAIATVMEAYLGVAGTGLQLPEWLPTPMNRKKRAAKQVIDTLVRRVIAQRQAIPDVGPDLLSMLMNAVDSQGNAMDAQALRDEVVTLILAGHETTAVALSFTLHLLAGHPEVQTRLHAEVDALPCTPRYEHLDALPFAAQVIRESMRLYPPAWAFGREALHDMELEGYAVKATDQLWIPVWAVHRDPRWFVDPERFHPDRWTASFEDSRPKFAYVPFGGGPRVCIGRRFALIEATILLATLARAYRVSPAPGFRLELLPSVTLRPREGLPLRVTRRARGKADAPAGNTRE